MNVADFDFELPEELIAQDPPIERGASRLLVLPRHSGPATHTTFEHLVDYLDPRDLLVLNNTKVFRARLLGQRVPSGGAVECLLIRHLSTSNSTLATLGAPSSGDESASMWEALMHPGQKLKPGARVVFERGGISLHGEVLAQHFYGRRTIRLWTDEGIDVSTAVDCVGHIPLPPYIKREDRPVDVERYQTVYASVRGSVAAPTAGLHFTQDLLAALAARGVHHVEVTLHVGYGTFKPVRAERVEDHEVDPEFFSVPEATRKALAVARREERRVIAVGTTTVRALESLPMDEDVGPATGETTLFIYPGHTFRRVDGMITNFHLPRSSLLMLVAAFTGRERLLDAYRQAIDRRYRFYSYGDAMLIV